MISVLPPYATFALADGTPLDGGKIYIGTAGSNPETTPIAVYWDIDGTIPAAQPIRTVGGYPIRNGSPSAIFVDAEEYSITVRNRNDALVYSTLTYESAYAPNVFAQDYDGAVERTVSSKLKDTVSVLDFGADRTGIADSRAAFQAAIDTVGDAGGGTIYVPRGQYLIASTPGPDGVGDGLVFPWRGDVTYFGHIRLVGDGRCSELIAGSNNMYLIRWSDCNGGVAHLMLTGSAHSDVIGLGVVPESTTQTDIRVDQNYNVFEDLLINGMTEGIVLKTGPKVLGADSGCWYNTFSWIRLEACDRGIWLRDGNTARSNCNRNRFFSIRCGTSMNTGIQIDSGDTNEMHGCAFEGINDGTSPNSVPTAIKIAASGQGGDNNSNRFIGVTCEGCTRDVDNANRYTEFFGTYASTYVLTQNPLISLGGYDANSGLPQIHQGWYYQSNSQIADVENNALSIIAHGKLQFPAVQLPSTGVNTLDDYEEGTWTPTLTATGASGYTYATQIGRYRKIGKTVYFELNVKLSGIGAAGTTFVNVPNLPFTVVNVTSYQTVCSCLWDDVTGLTAGDVIVGLTNANNTILNLYILNSAGLSGGVGLQGTNLTTTSQFIVSGQYEASA